MLPFYFSLCLVLFLLSVMLENERTDIFNNRNFGKYDYLFVPEN